MACCGPLAHTRGHVCVAGAHDGAQDSYKRASDAVLAAQKAEVTSLRAEVASLKAEVGSLRRSAKQGTADAEAGCVRACVHADHVCASAGVGFCVQAASLPRVRGTPQHVAVASLVAVPWPTVLVTHPLTRLLPQPRHCSPRGA